MIFCFVFVIFVFINSFFYILFINLMVDLGWLVVKFGRGLKGEVLGSF